MVTFDSYFCRMNSRFLFSYKSFKFFFFLSVFLIFFGRANQLLFWEAPFRTILWDEELMKPISQNIFGIDWTHYATSMDTDHAINTSITIVGILLLISAFSALIFYIKNYRFLLPFIFIGSLLIGLIVFLEYKEKFYHSAQLIEGSIQAGAGILYVLWGSGKLKKKYMIFGLKLIIALTFLGHGLYALGYYATPGNFIDMTIILLGIEEIQAHLFLKMIGILDILVIIFIFIPDLVIPTLIYTVIWGTLTAFARIIYYLKLSDFDPNSFYMVHDTVYRIPHGLIPLALLILLLSKRNILNYEKN